MKKTIFTELTYNKDDILELILKDAKSKGQGDHVEHEGTIRGNITVSIVDDGEPKLNVWSDYLKAINKQSIRINSPSQWGVNE